MPRERFWLCRLYLCGSILLAVAIGLIDPGSQHYMNGLNADSLNGKVSVLWLGAFAILEAIDTIGHDLLGIRTCTFRNLRRYRFLWLMVLVVGLTALIFQNAQWGSIEPVAWRYALDAMFALALVVLDIWTRRR